MDLVDDVVAISVKGKTSPRTRSCRASMLGGDSSTNERFDLHRLMCER